MPYHIMLILTEKRNWAERKLEPPKKGIGPCYEDKIARVGIRMIDLLNPEVLKRKIEKILKLKTIFSRNILENQP